MNVMQVVRELGEGGFTLGNSLILRFGALRFGVFCYDTSYLSE
jgi:hypothetical protein